MKYVNFWKNSSEKSPPKIVWVLDFYYFDELNVTWLPITPKAWGLTSSTLLTQQAQYKPCLPTGRFSPNCHKTQ